MPWYQVLLPPNQTANMGNIQEQFFAAHIAAGAPEDMAMFGGVLSDDGTPLYLSPATANYAVGEAFLRVVRAVQTERPPQDISFLVGHAVARRRFYAGQL
jgi:hypothetical protein